MDKPLCFRGTINQSSKIVHPHPLVGGIEESIALRIKSVKGRRGFLCDDCGLSEKIRARLKAEVYYGFV